MMHISGSGTPTEKKLTVLIEMTPELPSELRLRMQAFTRQIDWTYSVFWVPVYVEQKKTLIWGDGYYHGKIKTFKTIHGRELTSEELGLQRSQQLRDLCITLLDSNTRDHQASKPFALKVDDLADPEWFFLLSMTSEFTEEEGLVGRTAASGRYSWLCNANKQNTAVFERALPAKSSSIKTVVCVPLKNGVLEFGTTSNVPENSKLVGSTLAFFSKPWKRMLSESIVSNDRKRTHSELTRQKLACTSHRGQLESSVARSPKRLFRSSPQIAEAGELMSPKNTNIHADPSCEGPVESEHCGEILKDNPRLSAFHVWGKKSTSFQKPQDPEKLQWILKGVLFRVPGNIMAAHKKITREVRGDFEVIDNVGKGMTGASDLGCSNIITSCVDINPAHMLAERRRREILREKFASLSALIPNGAKMDKASILGGAIDYVKELENRVKALEIFNKTLNHGEISSGSILDTNTTEKCLEHTHIEQGKIGSKGASVEIVEDEETSVQENIEVVKKKDITLVNLQCPGNQTLLLNVLKTLNNFEFEVCNVRSSTSNGILSFLSQAKIRCGHDGTGPTANEVKEGLLRVTEGNFSNSAPSSSLE